MSVGRETGRWWRHARGQRDGMGGAERKGSREEEEEEGGGGQMRERDAEGGVGRWGEEEIGVGGQEAAREGGQGQRDGRRVWGERCGKTLQVEGRQAECRERMRPRGRQR